MYLQVVLRNNRVDICFLGHTLDNSEVKYPTSVDELEAFLKKMDRLGICLGGPRLDKYEGIDSACAEKDYGCYSWRHIQCPISLQSDSLFFCWHCKELAATFIQKQKRQEARIPKHSPRTKLKAVTRQNSSLKRTNLLLTMKLEEIRVKLANMEEATLNEKLVKLVNEGRISQVQVF